MIFPQKYKENALTAIVFLIFLQHHKEHLITKEILNHGAKVSIGFLEGSVGHAIYAEAEMVDGMVGFHIKGDLREEPSKGYSILIDNLQTSICLEASNFNIIFNFLEPVLVEVVVGIPLIKF